MKVSDLIFALQEFYQEHGDLDVEEKRQATILAIAKLAVERPGWDQMLGEIADLLHARQMYDSFKMIASTSGVLG